MYFPFSSYRILKNNPIFQPYSAIGKFIWSSWALFLKFFIRKNADSVILSNGLEHIISKEQNTVIIKGEKKGDTNYTLLNVDENLVLQKVTKLAFSGYGRQLTENEIYTLKRIQNYPFSPKLLSFGKEYDYAYFTTEAFQGKPVSSNELSEDLISIMITINAITIDHNKSYGNSNLKQAFSHGDLCPWNIIFNQEYLIYDWEMSGFYPIGYDLFMFILQYEILVNNTTESCLQILQLNRKFIERYFSYYDIEDYTPYLQDFLKIRIQGTTTPDLNTTYSRFLVEIS